MSIDDRNRRTREIHGKENFRISSVVGAIHIAKDFDIVDPPRKEIRSILIAMH